MQNIEISAQQFPEGSIEKSNGILYIYNDDRSKRWSYNDFIMEWQKLRHIRFGLEGKTTGSTWHDLMTLRRSISVETGEESFLSISTDIITSDLKTSTGSMEILYIESKSGKMLEGARGGFYGRRGIIEEDLRNLGALAITEEDLPRRIDVRETAKSLIAQFNAGKFEVVEFVKPPTVIRRLHNLIRRENTQTN